MRHRPGKWTLCCAALALTVACGDPLRDVQRFEDVDVQAEQAAAPAVEAQAERTRAPGLFGLLRGRGAPAEAAPTSPAADPEVDAVVASVAGNDAAQEATEAPETDEAPTEIASAAAAPDVAMAPAAAPRQGLFSRLLRGGSAPRPKAVPDTAVPIPVASAQDPEPQFAAPQGGLGGLFGPRTARIDPGAVDGRLVEYGTPVSFGEIVRVCDVTKRQMGKELARYPQRRPVYRLYDSKPSQTGPRPHYITGFSDNCARKFTASLAMFGTPQMHELIRYGQPDKVQPYSDTDTAYEQVKRRVCRVRDRVPCGGRMDQLAKDTVFISTYERFEGSELWANILLHGGEVVEKDKVRR
ncbi:hypothetical protein [Pseudaestuariivita sp.]|uniref:hypothetical protein n=1 Tax=Pseudaestuariivita sp. TaxID=2211669 RepID=UPI004058B02C